MQGMVAESHAEKGAADRGTFSTNAGRLGARLTEFSACGVICTTHHPPFAFFSQGDGAYMSTGYLPLSRVSDGNGVLHII